MIYFTSISVFCVKEFDLEVEKCKIRSMDFRLDFKNYWSDWFLEKTTSTHTKGTKVFNLTRIDEKGCMRSTCVL